eukprot:gene4196-biopygen3992
MAEEHTSHRQSKLGCHDATWSQALALSRTCAMHSPARVGGAGGSRQTPGAQEKTPVLAYPAGGVARTKHAQTPVPSMGFAKNDRLGTYASRQGIVLVPSEPSLLCCLVFVRAHLTPLHPQQAAADKVGRIDPVEAGPSAGADGTAGTATVGAGGQGDAPPLFEVTSWHGLGMVMQVSAHRDPSTDNCAICRLRNISPCLDCSSMGHERPVCKVVLGACSHAFHQHCMDKVAKHHGGSSICPMDSKPFTAVQLIDYHNI